MNNAVNKIKKRGDILAEYMVRKVDQLERENYYLKGQQTDNMFKLIKYRDPILDAAREIRKMAKEKTSGNIIITRHDGTEILFTPNDALYSVIEVVLKEYDINCRMRNFFGGIAKARKNIEEEVKTGEHKD